LLTSCVTENQSTAQIIAHRGYWSIASEKASPNSIRALELADRLGVYGSEFDVHVTRDNVPVVYHNGGLPDSEIVIQKADYNDLKDFRLPNGEPIPSLEQYLDRGKALRIMLILELKEHADAKRDREAARIIMDMVKEKGMENRVEYITFSLDAGKEFIALSPGSSVFYLRGDLTPKELKDMGFSGLDYSWFVMDDHPEYFAEAKSLGLLVNVWTVNSIEMIMDIARQGADFITTDAPEKAKAALDSIEGNAERGKMRGRAAGY
jgi:glycerophosphoryl diester phosphodiesterase